jgi:hypothetical protein
MPTLNKSLLHKYCKAVATQILIQFLFFFEKTKQKNYVFDVFALFSASFSKNKKKTCLLF